MTVCIAAITGWGTQIVSASDQMLTMSGEYVADKVATKRLQVCSDWDVFAAGDLGVAKLIVDKMKSPPDRWRESRSVLEVSRRLKESYQEQLRDEAGDEILSIYGWSTREFMHKALSTTDSQSALMADLRHRLDGYVLDCDLLGCGFDEDGVAHIFSVTHPGKLAIHDEPGFWAIGSGANAALSTLFSRAQRPDTMMHDTIYQVCEAKFVSERVPGVGEETDIGMLEPKGVRTSFNKSVGKIRKCWERERKRPIPTKAVDTILDDYQHTVDTREKAKKAMDAARARRAAQQSNASSSSPSEP